MDSQPRVAVLVNNDCLADSRVRRSSEALVAAGYRVQVFCYASPRVSRSTVEAGVSYERREPKIWETGKLLSPVSGAAVGDREEKGAVSVFGSLGARLRRIIETAVDRFGKLRRVLGGQFADTFVDQIVAFRPDIIHAHDLQTLRTGVLAKKRTSATLIYDSHELQRGKNANFPLPVWWAIAWAERRGIRAVDEVITVSPSIADHLAKQYGIARPALVLNVPDFTAIDDQAPEVRSHLGFDEDVPLTVYVGNMTFNRGLDVMVRALAYMPDGHFVAVGSAVPWVREELEKLADDIGVRERFHVLDPVKPNQVVNFIRSADVSVLPIQNTCLSHNYCLPNKLFESVQAGLPVVVADLVELRKFVEEYECGLVADETDPQDLADKIKTVVSNQRAFRLSESQKASLNKIYGWETQKTELLKIYKGLLTTHRG